jgi:hypothetical protein
LIVGDQTWTGACGVNKSLRQPGFARGGNYFRHNLGGVPRWWWNPTVGQLQLLPAFY